MPTPKTLKPRQTTELGGHSTPIDRLRFYSLQLAAGTWEVCRMDYIGFSATSYDTGVA